jgi:hypothetical protein
MGPTTWFSGQWLESLSPIFVVTTRVLWTAGPPLPRPPADIRGHGLLDLIQELFAPYHLFIEPSDLPLAREWSHRIQLLPGTRAVMMRRYRCAHAQENELEC